MKKVCPRCKLPQKGIIECEYCGLQFSKYSDKINWNSLPEYSKSEKSSLVGCRTCGQEISKNAKSCPRCGEPVKKKESRASQISFIFIFIVLAVLQLFWLIVSDVDHDSKPPISSKIGQTATINVKCYGSTSKGALDRAFEIVRNHDDTAFMEMIGTGEIIVIPQGTSVSVIDITLTKAKIRIRGESSYLWIYNAWLD